MDGQVLLQWVTPALLLSFAAAFVAVWSIERQQRSALVVAVSYAGAALAFVFELSFVRVDGTSSAVFVEDLLYLVSAACFSAGLACRADIRPPLLALGAVCVVGFAGGVFFGIAGDDPSRTKAVSYAVALLFGSPLWICRHRMKRGLDRILAVLVLLLSSSVALSAALLVTDIRAEGISYEESTFSAVISAILNVASTTVAITLLAGYLLDMTARLRATSYEDPMTGLLNRRGFEAKATETIRRQLRHGAAGVLLVADIDRFKNVNDRFGHSAGDAVIRAFGETIKLALPPDTLIARIGGEEFCAVLPDLKERDAYALAERVRRALPEVAESVIAGQRITASFGLAPFTNNYAQTFALADGALYEAKRRGRDRTLLKRLPGTTPQPAGLAVAG